MSQDRKGLEIDSRGVVQGLPDLEKMRGDGSVEPLSLKTMYDPYIGRSFKGLIFKSKLDVIKAENERAKEAVLQHFKDTAESQRAFEIERKAILKLWDERIYRRMEKLNGLRTFTKEIGSESRAFLTFLAHVPTALAMVVAYGLMATLDGKLVPLPFEDRMTQFTVWDRMLRFVRFRCDYAQYYLRYAANPLFLGAGLLPELWMSKRCPRQEGQHVTAYDLDEAIIPYLTQLLGDNISFIYDGHTDAGRSTDEWLEYHIAGINQAFNDDNEQGRHDYVFAMGIGSYYSKDLKWFFNGVWNLLSDGGYLVIDFQTMVTELKFDALILGWKSNPPLKPFKNIKQARRIVKKAAESCGFKIEQDDDDAEGNAKSAGVVFLMKKVAKEAARPKRNLLQRFLDLFR